MMRDCEHYGCDPARKRLVEVRKGVNMRKFNTTAVCIPSQHYMVDLSERVAEIKQMVDAGEYFTINRARQYGKTTTLDALETFLSPSYTVLSLDFQKISAASFKTEEKDGKVYDMFEITKLNFGEDHKVVSVTGHFARVTQDEDGIDTPEYLEGDVTYPLAADFKAMMCKDVYDNIGENVPVTDLYEWYVSTYLADTEYDGHELVFQCDLPDDQKIDGECDFWFVNTKIELNDQNEIIYMEYSYVPWA